MFKLPVWKDKGCIIDVALKARLPASLPSDIDIIEVNSETMSFSDIEDTLSTFNGSYRELYICEATPVYIATVLGFVAYNSETTLRGTNLEARIYYLHFDHQDKIWVEVDI